MNPLLSVSIVTYNHERYIAQTIDSVLRQEVDFAYEIVIGEDRSTDRTREIVADYQRRFPGVVRAQLRERNLGMMENFSRTIQDCRGKYIALLDGDDYWTDARKLQKQVAHLEKHPDLVACFHNTRVSYEDGSKQGNELLNKSEKPIVTIEDFIAREWFIGTATVLFRNGLVNGLPVSLHKAASGDWPLYTLLSQYGDFGYLDEVMAVYRVHTGSVTRSTMYANKNGLLSRLCINEILNQELGFKYDRQIQTKLLPLRYALLKIALNEGDDELLANCLKECAPHFNTFSPKQKTVIALCWMKQSYPRLFPLLRGLLEVAGVRSRVYRIAND